MNSSLLKLKKSNIASNLIRRLIHFLELKLDLRRKLLNTC